MSETNDKHDGEIPRTDICEECDREIVPEVKHIEGQHEIIHRARTAEEGFMPVTAGKAEIRFKCACSSVTVEFGPGSATAWDVPDAWMWEDNVDVGEEVLQQ
jgi:hypothetical protein